jgi:hypothetical protein
MGASVECGNRSDAGIVSSTLQGGLRLLSAEQYSQLASPPVAENQSSRRDLDESLECIQRGIN